jgi:phosphoglycerate kinase
MTVTTETMLPWCRKLIGADEAPGASLDDYLAKIPRLDALADVTSGTPVLVRGDVDAKPGEKIGEGDIRLRSMKDTLQFGRDKGWKQIVFGHIGRDPAKSLEKVANRIGEILGCKVQLVKEWLDPDTMEIPDDLTKQIEQAEPGAIIVLENSRKYDIERALWKAKADDLPPLVDKLVKLANEMASKVAKVYVHEAFSAGSLDASSTVVPAGMERVALGKYEAEQFDGPLQDCMKAEMVIFSGLKIDKLDDLEAMIARGKIRHVISGGSLAMALKKADAQLAGGDFHLGKSEDAANKGEPYYIPPERIEQAKEMISQGREKGIDFVLPVDFVLQDGSVSEEVGPGNQQFDVGPKSSENYAEKVSQFIDQQQGKSEPGVVFHNGVFGMFEDSRFEEGTRKFIAELKRMNDAGIKVYVGGGEGGKALEKYGQPDWVTYCFTAGGTVLNALGSEPVPYLVALKMAAEK